MGYKIIRPVNLEAIQRKSHRWDGKAPIVISGTLRDHNNMPREAVFDGFNSEAKYVFKDFSAPRLHIQQNCESISFEGSIDIPEIRVIDVAVNAINCTGIADRLGIMKINGCTISDLTFNGCISIEKIDLSNSQVNKVKIATSTISTIQFQFEPDQDKESSKELVVKESVDIDLSGVKNLSIGKDTKFEKLTIRGNPANRADIQSPGFDILELSQCKMALFSINQETRLEKVVLESCNLEGNRPTLQILLNARKVELRGSLNLKEVSNRIVWPRKFYGSAVVRKKAYQQIKEMMHENSEYKEETYFRRKELGAHYQVIRREKKSWVARFDVGMTLGLPSLASGFGTRLWQPILWLFGVHFILMLFMIHYAGKPYGLELSGVYTPESFREATNIFFYTILPTHRLSYDGELLNPVVSFVMRVLSGIFIYHIVLASRTHLK